MKKFIEKNFRTPLRFINKIKQKLHAKNIITKEFILNYLPSNPIILEAGACDGMDTIEWSKLLPDSTIHAFEPVPVNFEKLKQNTKDCSNIILHNLGLSSKSGNVKMHVSSHTNVDNNVSYSSSILEPSKHIEIYENVLFNDEIIIPTLNLDEWACQNNIEKIDFMWLDLQGLEYSVLNAAPNILKKVKLLYTEVSLIELYKGIVLYKDYKNWLIAQGFRVLKEDIFSKDQGNVLFIRN